MINCTYAQWSEYACSNPTVCENAYGLITCGNWINFILWMLFGGLVIYIILKYVVPEKNNTESVTTKIKNKDLNTTK